MYYHARIRWNSDRGGWDLTFRTGMVYQFSDFGGLGPNAILQAIRDRNGNTLRVIWSPPYLIAGIKSPNGRWVQLSYNPSLVVTQVQDDLGRAVSYSYDLNGTALLTSVTDAKGGVTSYTYDSSQNLQTITDPRGHTSLTVAYDASNRVQQETMADGSTFAYAYTTNSSGQITQTSVTDQRGFVRQVSFDSGGFVTGDTYALGTSQQKTFTFARQPGTGLIQSVTDPLGRQTTLTYDTLGNLTGMTKLAGTAQAQTYTYTYDPVFSNVTTITDPLGHALTYSYDTLGNLIQMTDRNGNKTTLTYNSEGEPVTSTDPLGHKTTFVYTFGDLTAITDPLGRTTTQFVDAAGRVVSQTDQLGNTTTLAYDPLDHVTAVTDALGDTTSTAYDPNENIQSITDPRGNTTYYTDDALNRLCAITQPLAGLSSPPPTCPAGATTQTTVFQYDAAGNLITRIDRKGQTTSYQYDALNRPTQVTYGDGSTTTYTYDAAERPTQIVDSLSGTITRTYDGLDRLTNETTPQGSVTYGYDLASRRTNMQLTDGSGAEPAISYTYDNGGRLLSVTQGTGAVSCNGLQVTLCFTYNAANLQSSLAFPNGVTQSDSYDAANQLIGITDKHSTTTLGTLAYTYDLAGRRSTVSGSWARTGIPAAVSAATYNPDNELTSWGSKVLSYDPNGNLTSDGTNTYTWNARNQLSGISGGITASFGYDALDRRTTSTIGGATSQYLLDGQNVAEQLSSTRAPTSTFLDGLSPNQYFTDTTSGQQSALLTDALGSTVALAGSAGTIQTQYTYDPFGSAATGGAASTNPIQYTGMQNDGTGQYFDHARYYSPGLDRFTSQDSIGCSSTEANLYRYVGDNPTNMTDPSGLSAQCVAAGALILVGAALAVYGGFLIFFFPLHPLGYIAVAAGLFSIGYGFYRLETAC
jgi:RHS repeat-associated protein